MRRTFEPARISRTFKSTWFVFARFSLVKLRIAARTRANAPFSAYSSQLMASSMDAAMARVFVTGLTCFKNTFTHGKMSKNTSCVIVP